VCRLPLEARLLFGRPFGRRMRLEALVGDRLAAFYRDAVRPARKTLLGSLNGGELGRELVAKARRKLIVVELRPLVAQVLVSRRQFRVIGMCLAGQRSLDSLALAPKQVACAVTVHWRVLVEDGVRRERNPR
jgi:dienelactone hydrolase